MIETITFNKVDYPKFQSIGNAAQFAIPFAKHVCVGMGVDVGCNRLEWGFPGAYPIDPAINNWDALHFPPEYENRALDFVFSSHCLEHLTNWVDVLDYWTANLRSSGVLFLYLPSYQQEYWRPWNNRKHVNIFYPEMIKDYLENSGKYDNIFVSGIDLNCSFMVMANRK